MIEGNDQHATLSCDWPGCLASMEMDNVESTKPALTDIRRVAAQYYRWRIQTVAGVQLDVCPEHPPR